ncbi:MAG: hypothetical protein U0930_15815 [Pirellulales bacterium]
MNKIARTVGYLSLVGTIVPPLLFSLKSMTQPTMQLIMLVSCVTWFVAAPFWMKTE